MEEEQKFQARIDKRRGNKPIVEGFDISVNQPSEEPIPEEDLLDVVEETCERTGKNKKIFIPIRIPELVSKAKVEELIKEFQNHKLTKIKKFMGKGVVPSYTLRQRAEAVLILDRLSYNYKKTAEITGITVPTLRNWNGKYGHVVRQHIAWAEKLEDKMADVEFGVSRATNDALVGESRYESETMTRFYELRNRAIDKVEELIPKCNSAGTLPYVLNVLSWVQKEINGETDADTEGSVARHFRKFINKGVVQIDARSVNAK